MFEKSFDFIWTLTYFRKLLLNCAFKQMKPNSANIKRKKKYKLHHKNEMLSKLTNFGNEWNDKKVGAEMR